MVRTTISKRILMGLLSLLMLGTFLGAACTQSAPAPATPPKSAPSPAAVSKPASPAPSTAVAPAPKATATAAPAPGAGKPLTCRITLQSPITNFHWQDCLLLVARLLEQNSGGRIKCETYPGEVLGKAAEHYNLCEKGLVEISGFIVSFLPDKFPLTTVAELPFMASDSYVSEKLLKIMYNKYLYKEFEKVHPMLIITGTPQDLYTTKKRVTKLEDVKGLKLRVSGRTASMAVEALGASPVVISGPELYEAAQRGTVDGLFYPSGSVVSYKYYEVTKYLTRIPFYTSLVGYVMNKKWYDELPADLKKVVDDIIEGMGGWYVWKQEVRNTESIAFMKKGGLEEIAVSQEEVARWRDATKNVATQWCKDIDGKGLPGTKAYELWMSELKKYELSK